MAKAKKKPARRKVQASSVVSRVQGGVKKMQRDAEALLGRARKEAVRLSREQKRALDRVVTQAKRLRGDFEKSVKRTSKDLESRSQHLLTTLEKDIDRRLEPVVKRLVDRLNLASRREVHSLTRQVHHLEQLLKEQAHAEAPAAPAPAPPPPPDIISPSLGD